MGRREENDGSRGRKSVSVESEGGVEEVGWLGGGWRDKTGNDSRGLLQMQQN